MDTFCPTLSSRGCITGIGDLAVSILDKFGLYDLDDFELSNSTVDTVVSAACDEYADMIRTFLLDCSLGKDIMYGGI